MLKHLSDHDIDRYIGETMYKIERVQTRLDHDEDTEFGLNLHHQLIRLQASVDALVAEKNRRKMEKNKTISLDCEIPEFPESLINDSDEFPF